MFTQVAVNPLPDDVKPAPHVHAYPPVESVQAFTLPPVSVRPHCDVVAHSFTFTHVAESPLPESTYPAAHVHVYPPVVSVQVLLAERFLPHAVDAAHSSTFTHVSVAVPLLETVYPAPHVQS
jgi:hypothetical protein